MGCCLNSSKKKKYTPSETNPADLPIISTKIPCKLTLQEDPKSSKENSIAVVFDLEQEEPAPPPLQSQSWIPGEQLGQGAFGRVLMGMNKNTGLVMAVKQVYFQNMSEEDEKIQALKQEIEMLSKLQHPNIVRYIGCETTQQFLNIFLEFVGGGSVQSMLRKFGCFPVSLIRAYLKQILMGLGYLHGKGVVHRDIKGANILVDSYGKPKLADFGSSKQLNDLLHDSMGSVCGTPNYMAPEVIKQEQYGCRADIWSLGCTVIEMATGNPPYSELNNAMAVMIKIGKAKEPPPIPEQIQSAELRDFIKSCLKIRPSERATVDELLQHPFLTSSQSSGQQQFDFKEWKQVDIKPKSRARQKKTLEEEKNSNLEEMEKELIPKNQNSFKKLPQLQLDDEDGQNDIVVTDQGQGQQLQLQPQESKTNKIKVKKRSQQELKDKKEYKIEILFSDYDNQVYTATGNGSGQKIKDQFFQRPINLNERQNLSDALENVLSQTYVNNQSQVNKAKTTKNTLELELEQAIKATYN